MKVLTLILILFTAHVSRADFSECRVAETTRLRMMNEVITKDSLAVTRDGTLVTLKEILADEMIHFRNSIGVISDSYQWMYNSIHKVEGMNKYLSDSFGEDVIITIRAGRVPEKTEIVYSGMNSGNYLTLICQ